jgi:hypothetical protein
VVDPAPEISPAIRDPAKAAVESNGRLPGPAKAVAESSAQRRALDRAAVEYKGRQRAPGKTAVEYKGQQPVLVRTVAEFNDRPVLDKMEAESSGRRDQDRMVAASNFAPTVIGAPIADRMAIVDPTATVGRMAIVGQTGAPTGRAKAAAARVGIATTGATGPIIGRIGFQIEIAGAIGERSIAMKSGIIGVTIGPTTTIGMTTIGGIIITIPILIGTTTSTGGVGPLSER